MTDVIDIAVIGAGGGGLTAAIVAAQQGRKLVLLEASNSVGGTYAYSTGLIWAPATSRAREMGYLDSPEDGVTHVNYLSAGRNDEAITTAYMNSVVVALDYLAEHGVPYEVVRSFPDYYAEAPGGRFDGRYLASPVFDTRTLPKAWSDVLVRSPIYARMPTSWPEIQGWGGYGTVARWDHSLLEQRKSDGWVGFGTATIGFLLRAALQADVDIRLEHRLSGLERTAEGWLITVTTPDGEVNMVARNVILATGAYDWNRRLQGFFDPHPPAVPAGIPTVDGEPILLALEAGASFASISGQILVPALSVPGEEFNGKPLRRLFVREPAFPGGLVVNTAGKRIADESFYRDLVSSINHLDAKTQQYLNRECYFVFDQEWKDKYWLGSVPPGAVPEWLKSADNSEGLAAILGIDAEQFAETLSSYNTHASLGEDPEFGRGTTAYGLNNGDADVTPNRCLRPLEGRLYAIQLELTSVGGRSGLRFDNHGRVLDWRDRPMDGLYAVGNTGAALVEGLWYNSGIANGRAMAFGYEAALHAAGRR